MATRTVARLAVCVFFGGVLGGCGKTVTLEHYPAFWSETSPIQAVAVYPFADPARNHHVGKVVARKLAAALAVQSSYRTFDRTDLQTVLDEQDLQLALGADPAAAAARAKRFPKIQALLIGAVTRHQGTRERQTRYRKETYVVGRDAAGKKIKRQRKVPYDYYLVNAVVSCTAKLVSVPDGRIIHATTTPIERTWNYEGAEDKLDARGAVANATAAVVDALVEEFGVTRKEVHISSDAVQTASELYDNEWEITSEFPAAAAKLFVVVELPEDACHNRFVLKVVRKDGRKTLAAEQFTWTGQSATEGFEFSPAKLMKAGGGGGTYVAKLYSGPEPIAESEFEIGGAEPGR